MNKCMFQEMVESQQELAKLFKAGKVVLPESGSNSERPYTELSIDFLGTTQNVEVYGEWSGADQQNSTPRKYFEANYLMIGSDRIYDEDMLSAVEKYLTERE